MLFAPSVLYVLARVCVCVCVCACDKWCLKATL